MDWARIDTTYLTHPKVRALSQDAKLLHLSSVLYCAACDLGDGYVPAAGVEVVLHNADVGRRRDQHVHALVTQHLWVPDTRGGFVVHNFDWRNGDQSEAAQARRRKADWRRRRRDEA